MKLKKDNVYKITVPIITNEELKSLDNALENDLDKIVQEITETVSKNKEIIILQKVIKKQQKEIESYKERYENMKWYFDNQEDNLIHKNKIKEKIEELESVLDLAENDKRFAKYKKEALKEEIEDLKELLGE